MSRTIRLLETELGRPLFFFSRDGGRLRINPAGRLFLEAVRASMRLVDDGAEGVRGLATRGPARISLPRALLSILGLPTIIRGRAAHPDACFYVSHDGDARAVASGLVDVAVVCSVPPSPDRNVEVVRLGSIGVAVYCGRKHALWRSKTTSFDDVAEHSFITEAEGVIDVG